MFLIIVAAFALAVYLFMQQLKFGNTSSGDRLSRIEQSANYKNGKFQNQSFTPDLTEGASFFSVLKEFMFEKKERKKPAAPLPSKKTDLLHLKKEDNVWYG
ncbi:MAG: hypothetical protein WDM90_15365 [Ferruginibacter sp.]